MCWSKTLLAIFLVCRLAHVVNDCSVLGLRELITFVKQEAWEHGLFKTAEYKKERAGFNDGSNPPRPAPAASICDSSSSNETKTLTRSVRGFVARSPPDAVLT